jgi:hypothetical protein
MTAREMFEELGYKQVRNDKYGIKYINEDDWDAEVEFDLEWKTFDASLNDFGEIRPDSIDIPKFKAIQKQLEELGWL